MAIDREGFRAWLTGQAPDIPVGHVRTSYDCALSLDESPLGSDVVVDRTHLPTEAEERAMAKARHPSNAAKDLGKASTA